ncbi:MAG: sulfotransferase [Anaerolineae bacterium]|nr:sulfotransferase [Anaerolineae bacterium]
MSATEYIFIGGSYRTGTDLLRNTLNASPNIAICGETHFLGNPTTAAYMWRNIQNKADDTHDTAAGWGRLSPASRQQLAQVGDISTDTGLKKVVDYLYDDAANVERAFWQWLPQHVERDVFLDKMLASDRSYRSLFSLMMRLYAQDKPIKGEKTPAHIHYVPTLLEWFPNAKFIHMFRDPRAIFLSQKKKKSNSGRVSASHRLLRQSEPVYELYMSTSIIAQWLRVAQLHAYYQQRYPNNYYLLRFEDLVSAPQEQLKRLCDFLGIAYTDALLDADVVNSSFVQSGKVSGFDKSVADRWRNHIKPSTNKWFIFWCEKYLKQFEYQV